MSNSFVDAMNEDSKYKETENGAVAYNTTSNEVLDLFATIGSLRTRSERDIENAFSKAWAVNPLMALRMVFYARDIRNGGLGERRTARVIWKWLANRYPEAIKKNMSWIPAFGRWDDLYVFVGTEVEKEMWEFIRSQWTKDILGIQTGNVSLMAKWLKSVNTSSKESRHLGALTAKALFLNEREYRKTLSALRKVIGVLETTMSRREWGSINYSGVPSRAMMIYRNAFLKRDEVRFREFLSKVERGEVTIKSGTLFPYDIAEKILATYESNRVLNEQWKALPNYVEGENNVLIMADTSGSMRGRPLATSVGLAVYFAERNKGAFANVFMTFSSKPDFIKLQGNTIEEKLRNAVRADWQGNTNIELAFKRILEVATSNNVPQSEMPRALVIISDMEFDTATRSGFNIGKKVYFNHIAEMFERSGYEMPKLIFWNADARQDTFHAREGDGAIMVSGQSASTFKHLIEGIDLSPVQMMEKVLNKYNMINL